MMHRHVKLAGILAAALVAMAGCESSVFQAVEFDVALAQQGGESAIIIKRGTTGIENGGTFDFGGVVPTSPVTIAFTIENRGAGTLTLTGTSEVAISGDSAFEIVTQPSATIVAGGSTVFEVRLTTSEPAETTYEATLSVASNDSASGTYSITVIGTSASNQPPAGSITIGGSGDPNYTSDTTPPLSFSVTDDTDGPGAIEMMVSNDSNFVGAGWQAYTSYISAHLLANDSVDGTKQVYVKFRDSENNESVGISDSIVLDTTGPSGSIAIRNDYAYAEIGSPTTVPLVLNTNDGPGSGTTHMRIANGSDPTGASWQSYSSPLTGWSLPSGFGTKQVSVQYRDALGNTSSVFSDTIKVDDAYEGTSGNNYWDPGDHFTLASTEYYGGVRFDPYNSFSAQGYHGDAAQGDEDWFKIYAADGEWPIVSITKTGGSGTLTLRVYRVDSNDVDIQIDMDETSTTIGSSATVSWESNHSDDFVDDPGYYYLRVTGANLYARYQMHWEDCDDCAL